MSPRTLLIASLLVIPLAGCEFGAPEGQLGAEVDESPVEHEAPATPDLMDDSAAAEVDDALVDLFEPEVSTDIIPGLHAAEAFVRDQVELELGQDAADALPEDLVDLWLASPEAGDALDAEARDNEEAPVCVVAAVVGGIWLDNADNDYLGLWYSPAAESVGPMGGQYRGLATPGGQWGGGFGTFQHRLGPQGGLYFRDFDGTGTFAGMWSAPASPYEGTMGGQWVRLGALGGYFFGVMTVCPW